MDVDDGGFLDEVDDGIAPWDGRRVPMTLLGGYLGSGKTTVLNDLLRRTDRPIAVLVNDVGEVNIDAALLKRRSGDTIELTDGCVCCSIKDSLAATLADYHEYAVEWAGPDLVFRLDGEEVFRAEGEGDRLSESFFAILNFAKINDAEMTQTWETPLRETFGGSCARFTPSVRG